MSDNGPDAGQVDPPLGLTVDALAAATAEADPESLAASVRLRQRFPPELAADAVTQVALRRRAVVKFGAVAAELYFTRDGLEQATRTEVADHRAARFAAAGARRVVDLGCGIGTDAMAMLRVGLQVIAVERDPVTAEVARANLSTVGFDFEVVTGTAELLWSTLARPGTAVYCDPARRTDRGRSWRIEDLSPGWSFVAGLLDGARPAAVKLGPGLAHRFIPDATEAEWLSHRGDTVELGLWAGAGSVPGRRSAVLADTGERFVTDPSTDPPAVSRPLDYLYEPAGAVTRSGGLATLAAALGAAVLDPEIPYLTTHEDTATDWAGRFGVVEVLPLREKTLRNWCREHDVGVLEIKTRGLGIDPATLRQRLKLRGPGAATVVLTRTPDGPTLLVVRRLR